MKDDVGQMMAEGVGVPHGVIEGMGQPCERVPVARVKIKKRPAEQTGADRVDMEIIDDILPVIPVDESVPEGREVHRKSDERNRTR
jgi:hypothetical protein